MNRWESILAFWLVAGASTANTAEKVYLIKVDGPIGPATATFIGRAVDEAAKQDAQCLIIQLDTPGGLLDSTKVIVQKFLASPVSTVVYVAPAGASAASAGCFITLAADVAAMAPTTQIGAAHPVTIGGSPTGEGVKHDETMKQKLENFATSDIETIAGKRKRNVEWAKSSVKESASISSEKALELRVIEILAKDLPDLLKQLDRREVNGKTMRTADAQTIDIPMSAREKVFQALWRPEVMFLLMLIAMYGIIGELSNPGAILPGVVGAIALILLLYMSAILPINIAGVALILLAIALFIVDVYAPRHGALTAGGIVAFFLGSLMLFDRSEPLQRLSLSFIIPATALTAAFFIFVVAAGMRAQFLPVKVGAETMIGKTAAALTPISVQAGKVFVEGEYWNATSDVPIAQGQVAEITAIEGLTLKVKPKAIV